MNPFISSIISGIVLGVVASLFFSIIMYNLRPKLKISPKMNKTIYRANEQLYGIKILNTSKIASVLDIRAELVLMTPFNSHLGTNYHLDEIGLKKNYLAQCNKYRKGDDKATYAVIFTTTEDIDALWVSEHQYLVFKVYAKHPFSGFSKAFQQAYYTKKNCIVDGKFTFGYNFDIS